MINVRTLSAEDVRAHIQALASVLIDCVRGGASVSFMAGISDQQANNFFEDVANRVKQKKLILIAAFLDRTLVGTVQVVTAMPDNQPHRAEIAKLLVARSARAQGVGAMLMRHAEEVSRVAGKTLLVLDTATGSDAERLYGRLGWIKAGAIPDYSFLPDGNPCGTTIFWKRLSDVGPASDTFA